jgi:FlgN protein
MNLTQNQKDLVSSLERLLIQEYQACQRLEHLTLQEREILIAQDSSKVLEVVEQKENLLEEIAQLNQSHLALINKLQDALNLGDAANSLSEILTRIEPESAQSLGLLQQGILTVVTTVKDLTRGNQALAKTAVDRAEALQTFLLSLIQTSIGYQRPGTPKNKDLSTAWEVDLRA